MPDDRPFMTKAVICALLLFVKPFKDNCHFFVVDEKNPFYGNRYALGTDISTRLIFDNDGELAGIQATVRQFMISGVWGLLLDR